MSEMVDRAIAAHQAETAKYVFSGEGKKCAVYRTPFIDTEGQDDPPVFGPAGVEKCIAWVKQQGMRAAIAAMREPTPEMLKAARLASGADEILAELAKEPGVLEITTTFFTFPKEWRAAIDEALK